jgi:hypothetical protein
MNGKGGQQAGDDDVNKEEVGAPAWKNDWNGYCLCDHSKGNSILMH